MQAATMQAATMQAACWSRLPRDRNGGIGY
jgi:hypothetical protein